MRFWKWKSCSDGVLPVSGIAWVSAPLCKEDLNILYRSHLYWLLQEGTLILDASTPEGRRINNHMLLFWKKLGFLNIKYPHTHHHVRVVSSLFSLCSLPSLCSLLFCSLVSSFISALFSFLIYYFFYLCYILSFSRLFSSYMSFLFPLLLSLLSALLAHFSWSVRRGGSATIVAAGVLLPERRCGCLFRLFCVCVFALCVFVATRNRKPNKQTTHTTNKQAIQINSKT